MRNSMEKDKNKRELVQKYELERTLYKSIIKNRNLDSNTRYEYVLKLNKLPRNSSKVRIMNRCIRSGRSKAVLRNFKISRIEIRELVAKGLLQGVTKSSW